MLLIESLLLIFCCIWLYFIGYLHSIMCFYCYYFFNCHFQLSLCKHLSISDSFPRPLLENFPLDKAYNVLTIYLYSVVQHNPNIFRF